jgi:hypothetical protein
LQLYVAEVHIHAIPDYFLLILYDPKTGRATRSPPRIGARWQQVFHTSDSFIKRPLVSSTTQLNSKRPQIIFEEIVHNGTMYNGIVYHYFEIGSDLQLAHSLAIEARAFGPLGDGYVRQAHWLGPNRLRLSLFLQKEGGRREPLGYSMLGRNGPGLPFRVMQQRPKPGGNPSGLITFCEDQIDDEFLQHGCDEGWNGAPTAGTLELQHSLRRR